MTDTLEKAKTEALTSGEITEALRELVSLNEFGSARITLSDAGNSTLTVGNEYGGAKFVGKTAEEALCKARTAILRERGAE